MTQEEYDEVADLVTELIAMAVNDPNVNNEHAHCWLGKEQRPRTIEIGERLNEIGGFDLMYTIHDLVRQQLEGWGKIDNVGSLMRMLDMAWNGVGEWLG